MNTGELHRRLESALNDVCAVFALEPHAWGEPERSTRILERTSGTLTVEDDWLRCGPFTLARITARKHDGALHSSEVTLSMMQAPFIRFTLSGYEDPAQPFGAATFHEGYLKEEHTEALLLLFRTLLTRAGS